MSISRHLLREFRPLFRMLEEPISRQGLPASYFGFSNPFGRSSLFDTFPIVERPALDVNEEADKYVLEAEVPGVKKDNIEVRIGDAGRSITIEGKAVEQRRQPEAAEVGDTAESKGSGKFKFLAAFVSIHAVCSRLFDHSLCKGRGWKPDFH